MLPRDFLSPGSDRRFSMTYIAFVLRRAVIIAAVVAILCTRA